MVTARRRLLALVAVLALVGAAACSDDDDARSEGPAGTSADGGDHDHGQTTDDDEPLCEGGDEELFPATHQPPDDATEVTVSVTEEDAGGSTVYALSESATTALAAVAEYAVTFRNEGAEMHELVVSRLADDEARSVADLLTSGELGSDVAAASACPGEETSVGVSIERPGRYLVLCRLPVGSEPGRTQAQLDALGTPSHATQGMITEVLVP